MHNKMAKIQFSVSMAIVLFFMASCIKNKTTHTFSITRPEYAVKEEVYKNIKTNPSTAIVSPGKMFILGNRIFLAEKNKGIHIINNSNPSNPINESFIPIPGSEDVLVKNNTMLVDCYMDLLSIDISNPMDCKLIHVSNNVFPERRYVNGYSLDTSMVVTNWITKDTTVEDDAYYHHYAGTKMEVNVMSGTDNFNSGSTTNGVGGSMARFVQVQNYLYTVSHSTLRVFTISNPVLPVFEKEMPLSWNVETIYALHNHLFIGTQTGMMIVNINNPIAPVHTGSFAHANVCDPVIADDKYAYVTLRSGTTCQGFLNELDIIDIQNMSAPNLLIKYPFTNPHGLSKDGELLFICDGDGGLKIFDAKNVMDIKLLKHIPLQNTFDVIAFNHTAFVSANNGLYQFDYSDLQNIQLQSKLIIR